MLPRSRSTRLERIYRESSRDPRFQHFRDLGSNHVPGTGCNRPRLVLVGEAPGKNEDEGGAPFVGRAGQMLDELLESIHVRRADIFITNVVKYRPPNNRTPTLEEIDAGLDYLVRELKVLRPQIVGLMGQAAVSTFFGSVKIGQVHGKWTNVQIDEGYWAKMFALYHPMFGVYQSSNRDMLFHDFSKMNEALNYLHQDMAVL